MSVPVLNTPQREQTNLTRAFDLFHANNPHVWEYFKEQAFARISEGQKRYSARKIFEDLRYDTGIVTTELEDSHRKILNDHAPYYARLFVQEYPQHKGFFLLKPVKGEK
jgi:hypothetical protein